jgi:hypothetical protein
MTHSRQPSQVPRLIRHVELRKRHTGQRAPLQAHSRVSYRLFVFDATAPKGFTIAHRDHEPSAARVGARASWTAATESSESPLWVVQPCRRWASGSCKAPNPKLQIPKKLQAPSSKTIGPSCWTRARRCRQAELPGTPLGFETWSLELCQPTDSKSVGRAKPVTSRTPSPHQSKTWRQIRRFREKLQPPRLDGIGAMKPFNRFTTYQWLIIGSRKY